MTATDATTPWHDPAWRVGSDNPLQAGLRLQQAWWRQACRGISDAGRLHPPPRPGRPPRTHNPLVVSMLPETTVGFVPNLMWTASVNAYEDAKSELNASAGILYEDRLRRNLLSSQPLCFNLFGFLGRIDANALLPWVRSYAPRATAVSRIRLEYSPSAAELGAAPLGGSAFDAFVEYVLPDESMGFIGIETKYHEDLTKGLGCPRRGPLLAKSTRRRPRFDLGGQAPPPNLSLAGRTCSSGITSSSPSGPASSSRMQEVVGATQSSPRWSSPAGKTTAPRRWFAPWRTSSRRAMRAPFASVPSMTSSTQSPVMRTGSEISASDTQTSHPFSSISPLAPH